MSIKDFFRWFRRKIFSMIIPSGKIILFESVPDFTDNTYPVYLALRKKLPDYKMIWLTSKNPPENDADRTIFYGDKSILGFFRMHYYLARCKVMIHCNGCPMKFKTSQLSIHLMHGSSMKRIIGVYDMLKSRVDYVNLQSHYFDEDIMFTLHCNKNQLMYWGYPRCDYLYHDRRPELDALCPGKYIIWLPTFRQHKLKKIRNDAPGSKYYDIGVPLFYDMQSLRDFNVFLRDKDIHILYKPHFAQSTDMLKNEGLSHFHIISNEDISRLKLQLYEVISQSEALITDYSSVFWDYLLVDRPMLITTDDLENWKRGMGFAIDIESIHDEVAEKSDNSSGLYEFISHVVDGIDSKREGRKKWRDIACIHQDGHSAERVAEFVAEKLGVK